MSATDFDIDGLLSNGLVSEEAFYSELLELIDLTRDQEATFDDHVEAVQDLLCTYRIMVRAVHYAGKSVTDVCDSFRCDVETLRRLGLIDEVVTINIEDLDLTSTRVERVVQRLFTRGEPSAYRLPVPEPSTIAMIAEGFASGKLDLPVERTRMLVRQILDNLVANDVVRGRAARWLDSIQTRQKPEEVIGDFFSSLSAADLVGWYSTIWNSFAQAKVLLFPTSYCQPEVSAGISRHLPSSEVEGGFTEKRPRHFRLAIVEEKVIGILATDLSLPKLKFQAGPIQLVRNATSSRIHKSQWDSTSGTGDVDNQGGKLT